MISLKKYRRYWTGMVERVPKLYTAQPLTIEKNMADTVAAIPMEKTPALFYLAPTAEGDGGPDSFLEQNMCVIFIMAKYDPRKLTSAAVLEEVQPVAEAVKARIVEDAGVACLFMHVDVSSISTVPETEFFGNWAGWSIGFTATSAQMVQQTEEQRRGLFTRE